VSPPKESYGSVKYNYPFDTCVGIGESEKVMETVIGLQNQAADCDERFRTFSEKLANFDAVFFRRVGTFCTASFILFKT